MLLARAAGAVCGMVEVEIPAATDRPILVASQFGNTTPCIDRARERLEAAGYEVVVFAATGTGGRTMESLIDSGMVATRPPSARSRLRATESCDGDED